jgi:hypothetical protein
MVTICFPRVQAWKAGSRVLVDRTGRLLSFAWAVLQASLSYFIVQAHIFMDF